jgi:glycosyltransferase involved in cell wall biosynthesis
MDNPLVSILMPVYNTEKYLRGAINSVLNQTFTDFEFIIINDGSTDNSDNIIKSYTDKRIRYINQNNQGVARSLNNGLVAAKGKYIWRHDSDDICLTNQLEKQIKFLEKHNNICAVSTQIAFMTNRGKIAMKYRQPKNQFYNNHEFILVKKEHFNPYSPITHATVLMQKDLVLQIGGYRTEFLTSEDYDLWLRLLEKSSIAVLNFCSYFVRLNKASATQMHKTSIHYYHQLCLDYADERAKIGSDPIIRGEKVPPPPVNPEGNNPIGQEKGKIYRYDLLDFHYKVMIDAKDWINVGKTIKFAIKDGWRLNQTWKGILFPLLGFKIVALGVKFKQLFK